MDPLTLAIIGAISAGAMSGLTDVGKKAVTDAYEGLKGLLKQKFGANSDVVEAVAKLEAKPESAGWKETLGDEIKKAGADQDADLIAVAEALLDKIKDLPGGEQNIQSIVGNYNAQADRGSTATVNVYGKGSGPDDK